MRRRGLRLTVDEPSARQQRNVTWLGEHPSVCAGAGAIVFAALGYAVVALGDGPAWVGVVGGAAVGAIGGWGFSVENRPGTPRGVTRWLYVAAVVIVLAAGVFAGTRPR